MKFLGIVKRLVLASCLGALVSPALATPPDVIAIRDQLFGISKTHVFVLRTTSDNMGLHIPGMDTVYLLAKNAVTGEDEDIWPVTRSWGGLQTNAETGEPDWVRVQYPVESAVNPFAVLAERGGRHLGRVLTVPGSEDAPEISLKDDLSIRGRISYRLSGDELTRQIATSIDATATALVAYPGDDGARMAPVTPQDLLADPVYGPGDCRVERVANVSDALDDPAVQLALLHCETELDPATVLVVVPPEE